MVAYGFKARFAAPILAGTKRQTIRKPRVGRHRHARDGEKIQLYTGLRTKQVRLLGVAECLGTASVRLNFLRDRVNVDDGASWAFSAPERLDAFARNDGLADWADMKATFREIHGDLVEFFGVIIYWGDLR